MMNRGYNEKYLQYFYIQHCMLAPTYSPYDVSTIGVAVLNCRVRNVSGCTHSTKAPTYNVQY